MTPKLKLRSSLSLSLLLMAIILTSYKMAPEIFSFNKNIDLKGIKSLKANIKINAGTLHIGTHTEANATFKSEYTKSSWKPDIKLNQPSGHLSILQPEEKNLNMKDGDRNDWDIKIPRNVETALNLRLGAGEGLIDLSGSKVRNIDFEAGAGRFDLNLANASPSDIKIKAGVGELTIDLSGKQEKDLVANIDGGIGAVKLILPRNVGVRVKLSGLGSIDKNDLKKQDGYYVNDTYGKTANTIDLKVNGGLGNIEMNLK